MKIHKEGKKTLRNEVIIIILLAIITDLNSTFLFILLPICITLFGLTLYFFRIPNREFERKEGVIYAPCDGKIVVIEETI